MNIGENIDNKLWWEVYRQVHTGQFIYATCGVWEEAYFQLKTPINRGFSQAGFLIHGLIERQITGWTEVPDFIGRDFLPPKAANRHKPQWK